MLRTVIRLAERREKTALLVVVLLAVAVRIGFALTLRNEFCFPDSHRYREVADNVLDGRGFVMENAWPFLTFPDEHRGPYYAASPPGYSAFLAGCRTIAGDSVLFVRLVQALMGAAICLVIYRIGTVLFDRRAGFAAAVMCALYPFFVFFSGMVLSETLFVLVLSAFVMMLVALSDEASFVMAGLAGAAAAWATQLRSSFLFMPLVILPVLLLRTKDMRKFALCGVCVLVTMAFFLMPWTVRNRKVLGHCVVTTTRGGMGLYEANSEGADGGPRLGSTPWPREIGKMGEYERDAFLKAEAKRMILADPLRFAGLAVRKAARMWNVVLNYEVYRTALYSAVSMMSYLPVMILALGGVVMGRRDARNWLVLLVPAVYFTAIHMVFIGSVRYRLPVMPFIMVLSACALTRIVDGKKECSSA